MFIQRSQPNTKKGFTLIEVIVAIALFTVVMTVALGALFMVINSNKQAKAIKLVVNNTNLAMESMTRDLRVGFQYCDSESQLEDGSCDTDSNGESIIYFTTDQGDQFSSYRLFGGAIQRRIGGSSESYFDITGSDVQIDDMRFYIQGTQSGDTVQPFVTIIVLGTIRVGDIVDDFHLQSTISQRKLAP